MPKPQQLTPTNTEGILFDQKDRLNTGITRFCKSFLYILSK